MALIQIEKASFAYEETRVFTDIDLSVSGGEIFCLFGPNGCGKTTLLNNILGILHPDKGKISIAGKDVGSYHPKDLARLMAFVPQHHEKTFPYRVREVVLMGRTPYTGLFSSPGKEDYEICEAALESVGIGHLAERIYTTLSGGETQLVMLARALAQEAPLIIMDEPASHLDFRHELLLLETIKKLVAEKGLTVILTTHSPNHAFYFENHKLPVTIAVMHERRIFSTGRPTEVLREENMARIFHVDSRVFVHCEKDDILRYIVPVATR